MGSAGLAASGGVVGWYEKRKGVGRLLWSLVNPAWHFMYTVLSYAGVQ